jgi:alpha-D-xyloside xylohydrolase
MCSAQNVQPQAEILRSGETIVHEPYAPNILRVTLSLQHDAAVAASGYGFVGAPERSGWTKTEFLLVHLLNRVS